MPLQGLGKVCWQHGHAVFAALAIAHRDCQISEIDIFHPQANALHQSQAAAVKQTGHQFRCSIQMRKNLTRFRAGEHHRQARGFLGAFDVVEPADLLLENFAIEKKQRAERLILR